MSVDQPLAELSPEFAGMVKCAVTGKWVPVDEIVEIQGLRVCAEGKEVLLSRLKSGEAPPGQLERPSSWRRIGCMILDNFFMSIIFGIFYGIFIFAYLIRQGDLMAPAANLKMQVFAGFVGSAFFIAYFAFFHGWRGQSIGKMAGRIRVVKLDGSPVEVRTAFLRAVYYIAPNFLPALAGVVFSQLVNPDDAMIFVGFTSLFVYLYWFANCVVALVDRDKQQAIHDRLAKTRVVMVP
ncbi:MAG: RDD family protein [Planctomycetes bacterium]|nr:RDD family protein [Planctomycetota bacterium]